jgi:hypothetical protein
MAERLTPEVLAQLVALYEVGDEISPWYREEANKEGLGRRSSVVSQN